MEFHGSGLDRMMEILADGGEPGMAFIEQLGRDPSRQQPAGASTDCIPTVIETRVARRLSDSSRSYDATARSIELLGLTRRVQHSGHAGGTCLRLDHQ